MQYGNHTIWRRGKAALVGLALVTVLVLPALLSACSSPEPEPTEPPVTIMRSEGGTATATPTGTPVTPAATQTPAGGYPIPTAAGTPRPTATPMAYPTP